MLTRKEATIELLGLQSNGKYLVKLDSVSYELNESQYKAINRKKEMPESRLKIWLKSYADENV